MNAILFIATLALIGSLVSAQYCNQRKEAAVDKCGSHSTLCLYPSNQPGPLCIKNSREVYTLTEEEKKIIVRKHNELRRKVASGQEKLGNPGPQPKAISMPDLVWDQEIANVAQRWAYQCDFGHDQCRNTDKYQCGQNVARLGTTGDFSTLKVEEMVQNWYNEVQFYPNSAVSQFRSTAPAVTGHYTQLVWAKSTKIGCGAAKYYGDTYKYFYLVCNYGPAGNFIGEPIYDTGAKPPAAANPKVEYQRPRQLPSNVVNTPNTARVPNVGSRLPNSFNVQQYFQQNGANTFKLPANVANIFGLNSNSFNPASFIQNGVNRIPTSQNGVTYNTERRFYYNVQ